MTLLTRPARALGSRVRCEISRCRCGRSTPRRELLVQRAARGQLEGRRPAPSSMLNRDRPCRFPFSSSLARRPVRARRQTTASRASTRRHDPARRLRGPPAPGVVSPQARWPNVALNPAPALDAADSRPPADPAQARPQAPVGGGGFLVQRSAARGLGAGVASDQLAPRRSARRPALASSRQRAHHAQLRTPCFTSSSLHGRSAGRYLRLLIVSCASRRGGALTPCPWSSFSPRKLRPPHSLRRRLRRLRCPYPRRRRCRRPPRRRPRRPVLSSVSLEPSSRRSSLLPFLCGAHHACRLRWPRSQALYCFLTTPGGTYSSYGTMVRRLSFQGHSCACGRLILERSSDGRSPWPGAHREPIARRDEQPCLVRARPPAGDGPARRHLGRPSEADVVARNAARASEDAASLSAVVLRNVNEQNPLVRFSSPFFSARYPGRLTDSCARS